MACLALRLVNEWVKSCRKFPQKFVVKSRQTDENVFLFICVRFWIGKESELYHEGMGAFIPRNTPHMMVAHKDSVTMEWGATRAEKNTYDDKFREVVFKINKERKDELQDNPD